MNDEYVRAVLSVDNLAAPRGAPVLIPTTVITEQQQAMDEYANVCENVHRFYFCIGTTANGDADASANSDADADGGDGDADIDLATAVRTTLFNLGKAEAVPRGAPGRLATAYGSLASAHDQYKLACRAEAEAEANKKAKAERAAAKSAAAARAMPLVTQLVAGGYLASGEKVLKSHLHDVLAADDELARSLRARSVTKSSSKDAIVNALLEHMQGGGHIRAKSTLSPSSAGAASAATTAASAALAAAVGGD